MERSLRFISRSNRACRGRWREGAGFGSAFVVLRPVPKSPRALCELEVQQLSTGPSIWRSRPLRREWPLIPHGTLQYALRLRRETRGRTNCCQFCSSDRSQTAAPRLRMLRHCSMWTNLLLGMPPESEESSFHGGNRMPATARLLVLDPSYSSCIEGASVRKKIASVLENGRPKGTPFPVNTPKNVLPTALSCW